MYVRVISNLLTFANNALMNVLITSSVVILSGHSMIDRYLDDLNDLCLMVAICLCNISLPPPPTPHKDCTCNLS